MARPLQTGDQAPDFSRTDSSTSADRRQQREEGVTPEFGRNRAPQHDAPIGMSWRAGQLPPNSFLSAPFAPVNSDDPNEIEVRELDIASYGDCYDTTSPMRVRDVSREWDVDTDHDGRKN